MSRHYVILLSAVALGAALSGCEQAPPPEFHLNMVQMVANHTDAAYQQEIANVLGALFGSPDEPIAPPDSGLDQTRLTLAAGPAWSDAEGVSHGLFRRHCVHCHGITGDGRGPTARFLNPYPRDYRKGIFKFKSTYNAAKPTDRDLHTLLMNGVAGTSMPSFSLLPQSEVESLVEYVKYLSIRGEMEQRLVAYVADALGEEDVKDDKGEPVKDENGETKKRRIPLNPAENADQAEAIKEELAKVVGPWQEAKDQVISPTEEQIPKDDRSPKEVADSIRAGRDLFYGNKANCIKCHGPTALGDGQTTDFDVWNKDNKQFLDDTTKLAKSLSEPAKPAENADQQKEDDARRASDSKELADREDVADTIYGLRNAIPRNLRKGIYRGGRRRIDVFWRIHAGIPGTPMPGIGATSPGGQGTLSDEDIWHIVDYVLSLPYELPSGPERALPINRAEVVK